jgi:hypothetical protein
MYLWKRGWHPADGGHADLTAFIVAQMGVFLLPRLADRPWNCYSLTAWKGCLPDSEYSLPPQLILVSGSAGCARPIRRRRRRPDGQFEGQHSQSSVVRPNREEGPPAERSVGRRLENT